MGVDVRIYLKPHSTNEHIFKVIQKVLGTEFSYTSFNNSFDPKLPTSEDNSWYLNSNGKSEMTYDVNNGLVKIDLQDPVKNKYFLMIHSDITDDNDAYEGGKLLSPRSKPLWCAVGKRLVDFFGGKMMHKEDGISIYVCNKPKFPRRKKGQEGDDRWYQFYNALNEEQPLSIKEIEKMKDKCAYPEIEENVENLMNFLDKMEQVKKLDEDLSKKITNKKKIKV